MALKLDKVSYKEILTNISYEFTEGKITSLIGASGSGKTTLSYILSNIESDYQGRVINDYRGREIGYVFQKPEESFIFSTVKEELSFGIKKYNYKVDLLDKRIEEVMKMVGLPISYLERNPFTLSSGEKKLLSIATILMLNPKLIIIDEPVEGLDNKNKDKLIRLLKKLNSKYNKTIIVISRDIEFILKFTDNYLLLKKGKVYSYGDKKELLNSINKLKNAGIEIPKIINFINMVNEKKNVSLNSTFDIKELMKDIYRNV